MADDYSGDINTTGVLTPGVPVSAQLTMDDSDWFKVHLDAGKPYVFALSGSIRGMGGVSYAKWLAFELYDGAGKSVASDWLDVNDQAVSPAFSVLPTVSGDYFVAVSGNSVAGGYTVSYAEQAPDDYANGVRTTGTMTVGQMVNARFEVAGDTDWFKFHAEAGQHYIISYSNAAGTVLPTDAWIADAAGNTMVSTYFPWEPTASGDYYLAASGRDVGNYGVTVKTIADDYSTNLSSAGQLAPGGQASGVLQFQFDADSFKFTIADGHIYKLDLVADSGLINRSLNLTVYDGNDQPVNTASVTRDPDGSEHLTLRATQSGELKLTVSSDSYWYGIQGHYTLRSTADLLDDFGDTVAGATPLDIGAQQNGAIQAIGDLDLFKVDLTAGVSYDFSLLSQPGISGVSNLSFSVVDAKGAEVATPYFGAQNMLFDPLVSGSYYLKVASLTGQPADYTLNTGLSADDFSANSATAGALTVGGAASGAIETSGDRDWFAVSLHAGSTYWFSLAGAGDHPLSIANNGVQVRIFDAKGALVASTDQSYYGSFPVLPFAPAARGTYYVEVAAPGRQTGGYQLSADYGLHDDFGNDAAHAARTVLDATVSGQLELGNDKDVFKMSVVAGTTYRIDMAAPAGGPTWGGGTSLSINDSQQYSVSQRTLYNTNKMISVMFDATRSGDYYFTVTGNGGYGDGKPHGYTLTASSYGLDDLAGSSPSVELPINGRLQAVIGYPDDTDAVKVHLEQGRTYVFEMLGWKTGGGGLDTSTSGNGLSLMGQSGEIARQNYAPGAEPRLTYTATSTGDFTLVAHGDGRATGSYSFSATQTSGDLVAPQLLSSSPADGSTGLSPTGKIVLTFSETVMLTPDSVFMLSGGATPMRLTAGYGASAVGHTVVLTPYGNLQPGVSYKLDLTAAGIIDLAGNKYAGGALSYNTVALTDAGTDVNDYLLGQLNGRHIDGGNGVDTVFYDDSKGGLDMTRGADGAIVIKNWWGASDTLTGIERLIFPTHAVALDIDGHGGQTYRLYQAAFNRTPDSEGLGFWMSRMDQGQGLQSVAHDFVASAEFVNAYGAKSSDADFVNLLYHNVLHRDGEAAGVAYWLQVLHNGTARENVLAAFSESQENQVALIGKIGNGFAYTPFG